MTIMTYMFEYLNHKKKTYSLGAFIVYSLLITLISAMIYEELFLKNIFFFSYNGSLCIGRIIFFYGFVFQIIFNVKDTKTNISLLNLFIPFELMVTITYFSELKLAVLIAASVFLFSSILITILITVRKITENDNKFKTIMYRLKASAIVTKFIFTVCFIPIIILALLPAIIKPAIEDYEFYSYKESEYYISLTLEEHHQTLAPLGAHEDEEKWQALDATRKTELLQLLLDMDAKRLGLPYRVKLETEDDPDTTLDGFYDATEKTVVIYNIAEKSAEECLTVLFHEVFHSAEQCYVDVYNKYIPYKYSNLYFFDDAWHYNDNFNNYISSENDILGYMLQQAELDADDYAEDAVLYYATEIFRHNNGYV